MSHIIGTAALSMIAAHHNVQGFFQVISTAAPHTAETDASSAASLWVGLLDDGLWDASWRAASTMFQAQLTPAQWATMIQSVRQPLGRTSSRSLQSAVQSKTLPGAPIGDYQVLQFQTRFTNKPEAIETIVLAHEQGGWRVSGYFIR